MQITRIILENIKSYRRAVLKLSPGTTAIRGHNGAGKSTLVEAIGFALFNFLPYDRARFVREGEKSGKVVIDFVSAADECLYIVERRCALTGSGTWFINDERGSRMVEGKDDVLTFLRHHLGIHSTVSMPDLFDNAIAVQQGTFTADFLMTPQVRKKKFDALLQIEDYRNAADNLRDTERHLRDSLHVYDNEITALTTQTEQLEDWQQQQRTLQAEFAEMSLASTVMLQQRRDLANRRIALEAQSAEVQHLEQTSLLAKEKLNSALAEAAIAQQDADRTITAQHICASSEADFTRYQQAQTALDHAHTLEKSAHALQIDLSRIEQQIVANQEMTQQLQLKLTEAIAAEQECQRLRPLAHQQEQLEAKRTELQAAKAHEMQLRTELERCQRELHEVTNHILSQETQLAKIQQLADVALALPAFQKELDNANQAEAASSERKKQLARLQDTLARQQQRFKVASSQLKSATDAVMELQLSADQLTILPQLETQLTALQTQLVQSKSEFDQADKELHASHGGLCPYLKEPCLNMRQKGMANLEEYFGERISSISNAMLQQDRERISLLPRVTTLQQLRIKMDRLPELESSQSQAITQLQEQQNEITTLQQHITTLVAEEDATSTVTVELPRLRQQVITSKNAANEYAKLSIVQQDLQRSQLQEAALVHQRDAYATDIASLQEQSAQLPTLEVTLQTLQEPKKKLARSQVIADTISHLQLEHARLQQSGETYHDERQQVLAKLVPFVDLSKRIADIQQSKNSAHAGYTAYLQNQMDAGRAEAAKEKVAHLQQGAEAAQHYYSNALKAFEAAHTLFGQSDLQSVQTQLSEVEKQFAALTERQINTNQRLAELATMIAEGLERRHHLKAVHIDRDETEATNSLLTFCRTALKDSGPLVTRALLSRISTDANRIYGEIIGDRSTRLTWNEEYEIELQYGANLRTFTQLSGGEQMSAALAVRLALLRTLTRSRLAIFDEPTQNMDGERRANLAEQIRRVNDFEQVLVISHDDTFEEGLDAIIRVDKQNGESTIIRSGGDFNPLSALAMAHQSFAE